MFLFIIYCTYLKEKKKTEQIVDSYWFKKKTFYSNVLILILNHIFSFSFISHLIILGNLLKKLTQNCHIKHELSLKHLQRKNKLKAIGRDNDKQETEEVYRCDCGREYTSKGSLTVHRIWECGKKI